MTLNASSVKRALVVASALVLCGFALDRASKSEPVPIRAPLSELPLRFDQYQGTRAPDLDPSIIAVLGVDDYVNRVYRAPATPIIGLYIGYYQSQRQGSSMHSPMNCLPGSGWQPIRGGHLAIPTDNALIEVNRYIVQKSGENMLVLYWYQSHGRVIASEYWGKFYMVNDAIRMNRTDAALVRVIVPIAPGGDASNEDRAEQQAVDFVQQMFPHLNRHLPV